MPRSHPPDRPEVRTEAGRRVRSGERQPEPVSRDLGCSAQALRTGVRPADLDAGRRPDGRTTAERAELRRLRRAVRVRRADRESLRPAAACFARETTR
jgi:transposase